MEEKKKEISKELKIDYKQGVFPDVRRLSRVIPEDALRILFAELKGWPCLVDGKETIVHFSCKNCAVSTDVNQKCVRVFGDEACWNSFLPMYFNGEHYGDGEFKKQLGSELESARRW